MRKTQRTVKSVNFAHDGYEDELLAYALEPARGKFGQYIKRLIERDRDGVQTPDPVATTIVSDVKDTPDKREKAKSFL